MCTINSSMTALRKLRKNTKPFKAYKVIQPNNKSKFRYYRWKRGINIPNPDPFNPSRRCANVARYIGQDFTSGCLHLSMSRHSTNKWINSRNWWLEISGPSKVIEVWVDPKDVVALKLDAFGDMQEIAVKKCTVKSIAKTRRRDIPYKRTSLYC